MFSQYFDVEGYAMAAQDDNFGAFQKAEKSALFAKLVRTDLIDSISVTLNAMNKASAYIVKVRDPDFTIIDNADIVFKNMFLRINAGSYDAHLPVTVYGVLSTIEPEFGSKDYPIVTLTGFDEGTILAGYNKETISYTKETVEQIVTKIAKRRGFEVNFIDPTKVRNTQLSFPQPAGTPDRTTLDELAATMGYQFFVSGGRINFLKIVKDAKTGRRVEPVTKKFFYRCGELSNLKKVTVKVEKLQGRKYGVPFGQFPALASGNLLDKETRDTMKQIQEGERVAKQLAVADNPNQTAESIMKFKGSSLVLEGELATGDIGFVPGANCAIQGIGRVYSGEWNVLQVRHSWGKEGFKTTFKAHIGDIPGIDTKAVADVSNEEHNA